MLSTYMKGDKDMAFFEDLGNTLSAKGKEVAAKAKEMSEVVSLKNQVSTKEKAMNQAYMDIGKKYYESVSGQDGTGNFTAEFATIAEAQMAIADLKKQIQDIKGVQLCDSCGAENEAGKSFCSNCGAKLEAQAPVQEAPAQAPQPVNVANVSGLSQDALNDIAAQGIAAAEEAKNNNM